MHRKESIPAIVVGQTVTVLGTLRSLALVGIDAYTVTTSDEVVRHSRWYKPLPGHEDLKPESIADWLPDLRMDRAVLFPCSDHTVWQSSRLADLVKERIAMSVASTSVLDTFVDKAKFATTLDELCIAHPRTWLLDDRHLLESLPDDTFEHVFLKPVDSQSFVRQFGIKAQRISSKYEAAQRLTEFRNAGNSMVLQEYVPGPSHHHFLIDGFVDRHHSVKALFARRRLRINPPDFGNSSCMVSVPLDEVRGAANALRRLLESIGYRGIFSAEFKFDGRDREFKILEVNARPWWYVEFATLCGANVCEMAYRDALGENVDELGDYRLGTSMVYTRHDYFACRESIRRGDMTITDWVLAWLRSWRPIFRWNDPLPACVGMFRFLGGRLARAGKWLTRQSVQG